MTTLAEVECLIRAYDLAGEQWEARARVAYTDEEMREVEYACDRAEDAIAEARPTEPKALALILEWFLRRELIYVDDELAEGFMRHLLGELRRDRK